MSLGPLNPHFYNYEFIYQIPYASFIFLINENKWTTNKSSVVCDKRIILNRRASKKQGFFSFIWFSVFCYFHSMFWSWEHTRCIHFTNIYNCFHIIVVVNEMNDSENRIEGILISYDLSLFRCCIFCNRFLSSRSSNE